MTSRSKAESILATFSGEKGADTDRDPRQSGTVYREPAPAVGVSVVANLEGDRQITLQTFFPQEASDEERHGVVDALMGDVDRQKAKYSLAKLHEDLEQNQKLLRRAEQDLEDVDANFERTQAELRREAQLAEQNSKEHFQRGYDNWIASGRHGERDQYKPSGEVRAEIQRCEGTKLQCEQAIEKNQGERDQFRKQVQVSIARYNEEVLRLIGKIAAAESTAA